jgi:hypothetical protein
MPVILCGIGSERLAASGKHQPSYVFYNYQQIPVEGYDLINK